MAVFRNHRSARRGTIIPFVAVMLVVLIGFIALAVDLGLMASAKAQAQRAADAAALSGARALNGTTGNNASASVASAQTVGGANTIFATPIGVGSVTASTAQYYYDTVTKNFYVSGYQPPGAGPPPASAPITATIATVTQAQQTFFAKINMAGGTIYPTYTTAATAIAVHRARDIGIILDFSGSMGHNSESSFQNGGTGINGVVGDNATGPWCFGSDANYPQFGHYMAIQTQANIIDGPMYRGKTDYFSDGTYTYYRNNLTSGRPDGTGGINDPAIVLDFYYDSGNIKDFVNTDGTKTKISSPGPSLSGPVNFAPPTGSNPPSYAPLVQAFNQFVDTSNVDLSTPKDSLYTNAYPTNPNAVVAMPGPAAFATQSPAGTANAYDGDFWPQKNGVLSAGLPGSTTNYAKTVNDFIAKPVGTTYNANFETPGTAGGPGTGGYGVKHKGYMVGPGYYGKSFWCWPPDPRDPQNDPWFKKKISGGDWRKRFFFKSDGVTPCNDNTILFNSSGIWQRPDGQGGRAVINYTAVLAWIKSNSVADAGPIVLPPNLRAGRLLYYSSIPTTVNTALAVNADEKLDMLFWKNYIDYVLAAPQANRSNSSGTNLGDGPASMYGFENKPWRLQTAPAVTAKITAPPGGTPPPYMGYDDVAVGPRCHFWFGPATMVHYLAHTESNINNYSSNWLPATSHEAQDWEMKLAISASLADSSANHPNDLVALTFFSSQSEYDQVRVPLSTNYDAMQNCLYFPYDLIMDNTLSTISGHNTPPLGRPTPNTLMTTPDTTMEVRPYDVNFNDLTLGKVANGSISTCPAVGFQLVYNEFSTLTGLGYNGRNGAAKIVIFETDGFPNTDAAALKPTAVSGGYLYQGVGTGGGTGNPYTDALNACTYIAASSTATPPGYTFAGTKAQIHCIAFGDLFDPATFPGGPGSPPGNVTQALQFLGDVQKIGNAPSSSTYPYIEASNVIYGTAAQRQANLKQALQDILETGIQISLYK